MYIAYLVNTFKAIVLEKIIQIIKMINLLQTLDLWENSYWQSNSRMHEIKLQFQGEKY